MSAPRDLEALCTDPSYEPTLAEWNWLVHVGGAAYLRVPERIATIRRHATPAELVRKALPIGSKRSFINLAAMPLHYHHRPGNTVAGPQLLGLPVGGETAAALRWADHGADLRPGRVDRVRDQRLGHHVHRA